MRPEIFTLRLIVDHSFNELCLNAARRIHPTHKWHDLIYIFLSLHKHHTYTQFSCQKMNKKYLICNSIGLSTMFTNFKFSSLGVCEITY